jgi:DNA-binding LacI/PurR family transcriptional regulator
MPTPVRAPVTLKHIARHTGLSIMTVSRVVRGRPDVSAASRRKVLAAVRRLGYIPNPAAHVLASRTAASVGDERIIGTILSSEVVTSHSYFAGIIQGIADEARRFDCHLLLGYGMGEATPPSEYPKMIREMMTRWLILVGKVPPRLVRQLHANGFSLVLVDMRPPIRRVDAVVCDDAQGAYEATRHLIKLGHRRIALIRGPVRHPFSQALTSGYRRALHEAGIPVRDDLVVEAPLRPEGGHAAAEILLKGPGHPTAIFTNDDMAIGALRALDERGLRVPEDVALVGYDDIEYATHTAPPLTTVAVPKDEMGRLAVRLAIAQMEQGEQHVFSTTVVSHTLLIRSSCGAAAGIGARSHGGRSRRRPHQTGGSRP